MPSSCRSRKKKIEGTRTRIAYLVPAGRSPLEVLRNYEEEIKARGGEVVFTCRGEDCGGDAARSSAGGGGATSLMMYFVAESDIKDANFSNGHCALTRAIADPRFSVARIPHGAGEATVTVHTYQLLQKTNRRCCSHQVTFSTQSSGTQARLFVPQVQTVFS